MLGINKCNNTNTSSYTCNNWNRFRLTEKMFSFLQDFLLQCHLQIICYLQPKTLWWLTKWTRLHLIQIFIQNQCIKHRLKTISKACIRIILTLTQLQILHRPYSEDQSSLAHMETVYRQRKHALLNSWQTQEENSIRILRTETMQVSQWLKKSTAPSITREIWLSRGKTSLIRTVKQIGVLVVWEGS